MATKKIRQSQEIVHPRRGEIYLVNIDPTIGSEIKKTRPSLIIQNDVANRYSPITIVAAITSKFGEPPYPTEVPMPADCGLQQRSAALLNQIRSIDRQRLMKRFGHVDPQTMQRVDRAIQISLGLIRV